MQRFRLPYIEDWTTPLGGAVGACEHFCLAACCGMDAYDLKGEHLCQWAGRVSAADVALARQQVDEVLRVLNDAPERFFFLDGEHDRAEVERWIQTVKAALMSVRPDVGLQVTPTLSLVEARGSERAVRRATKIGGFATILVLFSPQA